MAGKEDIFVPRDYQTIADGMLDWIAGDLAIPDGVLPTDVVPGSLELGHMEAMGVVMEEYEVRTAQAIIRAIPESCFEAFGFERKAAARATGYVVFTALVLPAKDLVVTAGSLVRADDGTVFLTTSPGVVSAASGISGPIPVQAQEAGPVGNQPAGLITRLVSSIPGVDLVSNPSATVGGAVEETEEARAVRFAAFLRSLARGTADALEYGAESTGLVSAAKVVEPGALVPRPAGVPPAGLVWIFLDDGGSGTALDPRVESTVARIIHGYTDPSGICIPGWKAAGIVVRLLPSARVPVRFRAQVILAPGGEARWTEVQESLSTTLQGILAGVGIGAVVPYGQLSAALRACDPDIQDLVLWTWRSDEVAPVLSAQPLARSVSPVSPGDPFSYGARCVLDPAGPEWVLA